METVSKELFELKMELLDSHDYWPRVYEVNLPCQWLEHCYNGKCPALRKKNGNFYCAKKRLQ